jgi:radical SAM superfamily enzyme YgiQ (UPF0313 family)
MRILLILPQDRIYRYGGPFGRMTSYAPLTLTTLAALVPEELNAHVDLIDEGVQKPDYGDKVYDVVGITCVASSSTRAYSLAEYWREKGAFVVLGGVHPTLMPEEASRYADSVVVGLAEETWPRLLRDWKNGTVQRMYRADYTKELPSPVPKRELQASNRYLPIPTITANRGCRNHCEFCSVHKMYGRNSITRPISDVIDELKSLNTKLALFLDPNLTADREYAKELFRALIPLGLRWGGPATANIVRDKELLELLVKSGCEGLLIGFESLSQSSMDNSGKSFNRVGEYKQVVKTLHDREISVLGCFVLGFDDDTLDDLKRLVEIVDDLEIDLLRYAVLTPFPGTNLFSRLEKENRILTRDWSLYDSEHVIFCPRKMHPGELQQILYDTWKRSFAIGRIAKRTARAKKNRLLTLAASIGVRYYARRLANEGTEHLAFLTNLKANRS